MENLSRTIGGFTYLELADVCKYVLDHGIWRESYCPARALHDEMIDELGQRAQAVYPEVGVRLHGRRGRVDLLVIADVRVGIELDNQSPRKRSLEKLRLMQVEHRLVCLRAPWRGSMPRGIDLLTPDLAP